MALSRLSISMSLSLISSMALLNILSLLSDIGNKFCMPITWPTTRKHGNRMKEAGQVDGLGIRRPMNSWWTHEIVLIWQTPGAAPPSKATKALTREQYLSCTQGLPNFTFEQFAIFILWDAISPVYRIHKLCGADLSYCERRTVFIRKRWSSPKIIPKRGGT